MAAGGAAPPAGAPGEAQQAARATSVAAQGIGRRIAKTVEYEDSGAEEFMVFEQDLNLCSNAGCVLQLGLALCLETVTLVDAGTRIRLLIDLLVPQF